jgi:hypothetical protein
MLVPRRAATWFPERAQDGVLGQALDRFHHGPADQPGALFGDMENEFLKKAAAFFARTAP